MLHVRTDDRREAYVGWRHWRASRELAADADSVNVTPGPSPPTGGRPVDAAFCPCCWANGRILSPAANGEGLVPLVCDACAGTGRVG